MQPAKIRLSPEETALVLDPHWILTKRSVMEKTGALMGTLADVYRTVALNTQGLPEDLAGQFPKISRGENYQGMPYMILDYPAVFDRTHVFAVRTFFWWGHYFSLTLHLKGRYLDHFLPSVLVWLSKVEQNEWHVSISDKEWVHDVHGGDYAIVSKFQHPDWSTMVNRPFVKVVGVLSLEQWDNLPELLKDRFSTLVGSLVA
jgi:hypothetical protein